MLSEEEFRRLLKNCSFEVNYLVWGGDQPIISSKTFARPVPTYLFYISMVIVRFCCTKE
jgi:hypothetical protein